MSITETERDAWDYVHRWAERTTSDRVRNRPDEDALVVASGFLDVEKIQRADGFVGRVGFTACGDTVNVALHDPRRILHGVVHHHPEGMPMQGWLSTQRIFENEATQFHIGVNGELYRPGTEAHIVHPEPLDVVTKLMVLTYFQDRVDTALAASEPSAC